MDARLKGRLADVEDYPAEDAVAAAYDLGIWAAGYEARSSWLVGSKFRPPDVDRWYKAYFVEHGGELSAETSKSVRLGDPLGGAPGHQNHDGYWVLVLRDVIEREYSRHGKPLNIFVDYSSMPRTLYGPLVIEALTTLRALVNSVTFGYVPGEHAENMDGSRGIAGLRPLIGTEGTSRSERNAFVLGLGYDGTLSQAIVEMFQVAHFSCLLGAPGVSTGSVGRAVDANRALLSRSEIIAEAPAWSVELALDEFLRLCDWYIDDRDVLLVPIGPKPHVLAGILTAIVCPDIGFRFPQASYFHPVEVTVADNAIPYFTKITLTR